MSQEGLFPNLSADPKAMGIPSSGLDIPGLPPVIGS